MVVCTWCTRTCDFWFTGRSSNLSHVYVVKVLMNDKLLLRIHTSKFFSMNFRQRFKCWNFYVWFIHFHTRGYLLFPDISFLTSIPECPLLLRLVKFVVRSKNLYILNMLYLLLSCFNLLILLRFTNLNFGVPLFPHPCRSVN